MASGAPKKTIKVSPALLRIAIRRRDSAKVIEQIENGARLDGVVSYVVSCIINVGGPISPETLEDFLFWRGDAGSEILETILKAGADPNQPDIKYGNFDTYPLIYAARHGNVNVTRLLLQYGADPNIKNGHALIFACDNADFEVASLLIDSGANPKATGNWGVELPINAVCDVNIAKNVLPSKWDDLNSRLYGRTAFEKRIIRKQYKEEINLLREQYEKNIVAILQLLIDHGIDIDECDQFGVSPSEEAVVCGNYPAFNFLLNAGAKSAKALYARGISDDGIKADILKTCVVNGMIETYGGFLLDLDAWFFPEGKTSFRVGTNAKAFLFFPTNDSPSLPSREDIIYVKKPDALEVSTTYYVDSIFEAEKLPPYRNYFILKDWTDLRSSKSDIFKANSLLEMFWDDEDEQGNYPEIEQFIKDSDVIADHPNTYNCAVYRKTVTRKSYKYTFIGYGYALPIDNDESASKVKRGDGFRFLIESEEPSGTPGWFDIRPHDMMYLLLGTGPTPPKLGFEIVSAKKTTFNHPPYNKCYIAIRRDDLDLLTPEDYAKARS